MTSLFSNLFKSNQQNQNYKYKQPSISHEIEEYKHNNSETPHSHSNDIEYNMKKREKINERTIRILLLGPGDSGKTTIVKQMKKIHSILTDADIEVMIPYIKDAVIVYIKILCQQSEILCDGDTNYNTQLLKQNHEIWEEFMNMQFPYTLDLAIAKNIALLWMDPAIRQTLALRHMFQIHDNVEHFLNRVEIIAEDKYIPSFEDYICIRTRSTGFAQTKFNVDLPSFGNHIFEITDVGGQRSERKKWFRVLNESIHAILYVVAISEYDLNCFEDNETNRMHEAIELFSKCVRERYLDGKSVILFFNKYDLFKEKIKHVPITVAFDDYPEESDPNDENDVCRFIAGKFLEAFNVDNKITIATVLHIHRTRALDTDNIEKVFKDITLDLVKINMKKIGF